MEIAGIQLSKTAVLYWKSKIIFDFGHVKNLSALNFKFWNHALGSLWFSMSGSTRSWNFQIFEDFIKSILLSYFWPLRLYTVSSNLWWKWMESFLFRQDWILEPKILLSIHVYLWKENGPLKFIAWQDWRLFFQNVNKYKIERLHQMLASLPWIMAPRCVQETFKKRFGLYGNTLKLVVEIEVLSSDYSGTGMVNNIFLQGDGVCSMHLVNLPSQ